MKNLLTFCRFENCVWVPCFLVFVVVTGVSGKHFVNTPAPTAPATAAQICSFGATVAGNMISWGALSSDYTVYFHPRVSRFVIVSWLLASKSNLYGNSWRLFVYSYLGLNISTVRCGSVCLPAPLMTYRSLSSA